MGKYGLNRTAARVVLVGVLGAVGACGSPAATSSMSPLADSPSPSTTPSVTVPSNAKAFAAEASATQVDIDKLKADIAKSCRGPDSGGTLGDIQAVTCSLVLSRVPSVGGVGEKALKGVGAPSPEVSSAVAQAISAMQRLAATDVSKCSMKVTADSWLADCAPARIMTNLALEDVDRSLARLRAFG